MGEDGIGIGDEVFIVGLFAKMEGNTKMLPIVRTGTIAMIPPPNERISVTWIPKNSIGTPAEMEGYLIEARSISGISGAPVFSVRMMLQNSSSPPKLIYVSHLLGLVTGHWDLPPDTAKPSANEPDVDGSDESNKPINMGIAIVTPAKKILETLNHPELVQRRIEGVFV
ncbi:MAG: hypothetical protein HY327_07260 [Chloroflexi bacterium]|nr:hypothetical protein [Chloroflexota bacterium]